jgi:4-hydroxy-3-methylbut-2-enyl diphosphate reductase
VTAVVLAPLAVERRALSGRRSPLRVVRTGMGAARSAAVDLRGVDAVLVAGVCGGLDPVVRPGDLMVASEARGRDGTVASPSAPLLTTALRRLGLTVHMGPIWSSERVVDGAARRRLAGTGALAVDLESAPLGLAAAGRPFAAVRAVVDTAEHPLWRIGTVWRGIAALRALRRAVPALDQWARATGRRAVRLTLGHDEQAVRILARTSDVIIVIDPTRSWRPGPDAEPAPVHVVGNADQIDLAWLAAANRIGLVVGASVPGSLVDQVVAVLAGLGAVRIPEEVG